MVIEKCGEEIILDKEKALYLPYYKTLVISDLHLGKSAHFRKAGLPVPVHLAQHDLKRLHHLVEHYKPDNLLINGDMFHHDINGDIIHFKNWRNQYSQLNLQLVKGNHDRLGVDNYQEMGIEVYERSFHLGNLSFIHQLKDRHHSDGYAITGHVHPGINLLGRAKQRLRFPCFYFANQYAVLPAFSVFTGLCIVQPQAGDHVYAIMPNKVLALK